MLFVPPANLTYPAAATAAANTHRQPVCTLPRGREESQTNTNTEKKTENVEVNLIPDEQCFERSHIIIFS